MQALEAARIMGRVAAHELGHYLLADTQTSARRDLMRARFDGADLLGSASEAVQAAIAPAVRSGCEDCGSHRAMQAVPHYLKKESTCV